MDAEGFKKKTKDFALRIIRLVQSLPRNRVCDAIGGQLVRSGTSPAANYRAACRARSRAEFVAKMGTVEEEADETMLWLELLVESGIMQRPLLEPLIQEANEIVAMSVSSKKTVRAAIPPKASPPNRQSSIVNRQSI